MSGPEIITFGCRLNSFGPRSSATTRKRRGWTIWSWCTPARSPPKRSARRARRSGAPAATTRCARIVVTGCSAQIRPEAYAAMAEVDQVVGNHDKLDAGCGASSRSARG